MLALMATYSTSRLIKNSTSRSDRPVVSGKMAGHDHKHHHSHHHGHISKELPVPHTLKLTSPLKVSVELVGPAPQKSGDTFQLRVHMYSSQPIDHALLIWDLPEGVKMISGALEQSFLNIEPGQNSSYDVLFEQVSNSNEQIHLTLKSQSPGMQFSSMAQYNSLDQADIDRAISSLKQRSDDYIKSQQSEQ